MWLIENDTEIYCYERLLRNACFKIKASLRASGSRRIPTHTIQSAGPGGEKDFTCPRRAGAGWSIADFMFGFIALGNSRGAE